MMGLTIPAFPRTVKNHEIIRISGISAETWTEYHSNTYLERYNCRSLFGEIGNSLKGFIIEMLLSFWTEEFYGLWYVLGQNVSAYVVHIFILLPRMLHIVLRIHD
jgi:hypothetical protein